jgi:hypothetical protein
LLIYELAMQAKFITIGNFTVPSRNLFVVVGDVIEGDLKPGATVSVEAESVTPEPAIPGVELVEASFRSQPCMALVFTDNNLASLAQSQGLSSANETLLLSAG